MNRRTVLSAGAALALTAVASAKTDTPKAEHAHHHDHGAHAASSNPYATVQQSAAACHAAGLACIAHCIRLLSAGDTSMKDCAAKSNQMTALCGAMENLAAQRSSLVRELAKVCAKACRECAEACKPHATHHAECKACYEACLECAAQCEKLA